MAQTTAIGVVISTPGRASLYRTLRSIAYQGLIPGDDIIVVGDGFHQATKDLVEAFGPPFRYVATQVTRDWGHSQVNFGLKRVKGDVVVIQDDDDIFLPRAFEEIRRLYAANPGNPMIGRVKTPAWGLLWKEPGIKTLLDGHCMVVPNEKDKLGYMSVEYYGDQCYIATCLDKFSGVNWVDRVWTLARPEWKLFPRRAKLNHTLGPDHMQMYTDILKRMKVDTRPIEGADDWLWWFETEQGYLTGAVRLYEEDGNAHATIGFIPGTADSEIEEMVEFAAWAAQGLNCWFYTGGEEREGFIDALHRKKFEDHVVLPTKRDFVMEWPPSWFPGRIGLGEITDERGVKVPDWRDKWGPDAPG